jgi:HAMP domain-containing protein
MATNNACHADGFGQFAAGAGLLLAGIAAGWWLHDLRALSDTSDELEQMLAAAPFDDEEEAADEVAAVAMSLAERDRGEVIPWERVRGRQRKSFRWPTLPQ